MKTCQFCAEEIQDAAIVCRYCGRDLATPSIVAPAVPSGPAPTAATKKTRVWPWVVFGSLVLLIIISSLAPNQTSKQLNDPAKRQALEDLETKMESIGLVKRVEPDGHRVQVDPVMWGLLNADQKSATALNLAAYCAIKTDSSSVLYADIIDAQSGRKLAEYGATGFKVD